MESTSSRRTMLLKDCCRQSILFDVVVGGSGATGNTIQGCIIGTYHGSTVYIGDTIEDI